MMRKLCALLAALGLTVGAAAAFSDVQEGDWHPGAVEYVSEHGLMDGVSGDLFAPDTAVTRGMVVTVLYRLEGAPEVAGPASFPDVGADTWYGGAVAWAQGADVAAGYGSGDFGPNDIVTREQLAVFLQRYAVYKGMEIADGVLGGYRDEESISFWALDGMKHAVGAGLIAGRGGDMLEPGGVASRAELAVILQRLMTPAAG